MPSSLAASPSSVRARPSRARTLRAEAFGLTNVGLLRATNEDAYAVADRVGLYAVADGVGGNAAGEVASRMAIDTVVAYFENIVAARPGPGAPQEAAWQATFAASLFAHAVAEANAVVWSAAMGNQAMAGMGTTFTGLFLLNERAVIAHLGDSRAYLLRGRRLHQLTDDHTLVAAYMQSGVMTREEAATSDLRNIITRALGPEEHVEVDTRVVDVEPGDVLLLSSDGLHGLVEDDEIAAILLREQDLTRAAARLIESANDRGGHDNITAVLVRIVAAAARP